MAKTSAAGFLSAIAAATAASLNQNNAYADGVLPPNPSEVQPSPAPPKVRNDHPRTTSAGFDPEALERGVKALREISKSPHGKKVFEVIKKQEETKQTELAAKVAEFRQMKAQHETERQRIIYDEQKKLAQHQAQTKSQMAKYEDELARKRMQVLSLLKLRVFVLSFYECARVIWGYIDRILGQPSLIRESSRGKYPWSGMFSRAMGSLSRRTDPGSSSKNGNGFGDVILHPSLQKRIQQLSSATANTKAHQAPFRNMLFYGPPGTGKTMAARELARKSGLDYALMTGGDVAPLGSQAVTKIHQLFDWAKKSNKGLLLFIDEADAFLCERNKTYMSEAQRSALNALLYRTGDQSKDIVLALATNRPGDLDSAVADRIDEVLEFPLPGEEERFKLLKLYLDKYIAQAGSGKSGFVKDLFKEKPQQIEIKGLTDDIIKEAAAKTEGFSGREIAKLMASVQAAVYGSENCVLDPSLFREVVDYKVAEHQQRRKLAAGDKPMA
ncbi:hypothetical protein JHK82_032538 [Glycine max]|nr:hypothetical protein JHK85_033247 [Glycine max]KAG5118118.1 hypothetical protein JHK82_032538 [Glycine max]KAG5139102.1 hypothetical protein JHK84_032870 [Glycine max]